jgi:hypothetical protein
MPLPHRSSGLSDPAMMEVSRTPALCGVDEVMVSATCVVTAGSLTQAPTTVGTTGVSCGQSAGQSEAPLAIVLCAKR